MAFASKNQISYIQSSRGRSGHALKDLFTSVILGELLNLDPLYTESWEHQKIVPISRVRSCFAETPNSNIVELSPQNAKFWDGIPFSQFERIQEIVNSHRKSSDVLFTLRRVTRIHITQVYRWEEEGYVECGVTRRILGRLRMLYGVEIPAPIDPSKVKSIVIHIRRGDIANPSHKLYATRGAAVWTAKFYCDQIEMLARLWPHTAIDIFTEKANSEEIDALLQVPSVSLYRGSDENVCEHFSRMVHADFFIPSDSSLSYWASFLCTGIVYKTMPITHLDFSYSCSNWVSSLDSIS